MYFVDESERGCNLLRRPVRREEVTRSEPEHGVVGAPAGAPDLVQVEELLQELEHVMLRVGESISGLCTTRECFRCLGLEEHLPGRGAREERAKVTAFRGRGQNALEGLRTLRVSGRTSE